MNREPGLVPGRDFAYGRAMDDVDAGWIATPLAPALRVETVAPPPPPPAAAAARAAALWDAAVAARPGLFNGRVFSALEITPERITGYWTEYRLAYAQIRAPELFAALGVRALAVNGVLHGPDYVLFGKRDARAVYQAGQWQCPPAGSVEARAGSDEVDLAAQVRAELAEELGLGPETVGAILPLAAVEHPGSHVVDVGLALPTTLAPEAVAAAHAAAGNREYERLAFVRRDRLEAQLAAWNGEVVPPARVFVRALGGG